MAYYNVKTIKGDIMKSVYMDNAATTPVLKEAFDSMQEYFMQQYANPSSAYDFAQKSRNAIDTARKQVSDLIGAQKDEIYFTSGGSEADNWAIKGAADFFRDKKRNKIVTTPIEHHAVLNTVEFLTKYGFDVEYIPVNENGIVDLQKAEKIIDDNTAIVSVMLANNETGALQPVKEIAVMAHNKGAYFHTDAVQAAGHIKIDVKDIMCDMLSVSGHKFGAPKGIGFLYKKNGIEISNLIHGGSQEKGLRAGTENVPYIVALGTACKISALNLEEEYAQTKSLRDFFENMVLNSVPNTVLNGPKENRLPGTSNISFLGLSGKSIVSSLSSKGICVSSQSACASKSDSLSHVLKAMGLKNDVIRGAVRFTVSNRNTKEEIIYTAQTLEKIIKTLRSF